MFYLQLLLNGIIAGAIYALFAVGLTMTYGIFRFINFAHGELIAWGAYGVLLFQGWPFDLPMIWAVPLALALTMAIGLAADRLVYSPLRHGEGITLLIASIGLSFLLRNALQFFFGSDLLSYDVGLMQALEFGEITISEVQLIMAACALVFLGGLYLLLTKTLLGKGLRAVADNLELAGIMGLPMQTISRTVWCLASLFAGVGGILLAWDTNLDPMMGTGNLIKAFAAVLLGGAGNVWGALLGGLFIGVAENLSVAFIDPGYKDFIAFSVIVLMLLFKPHGLFAMARGVR
ncbi:branched-chain amino acid ABC transporter permease [Dethiosulfatarculus sandiegensis]|uniref:ABC transporter permease n=1 Tax=Dethiosulfatarculus sandiegensis TaxID=1429043 RepID=A0A0D2IYP8_9BACT|nr:branched-chain amino acid ABC transporter permease [Dethiosulfatarculus sandiegensis]KIX11159.1 ABC transporter permease [Dethiosulfatarculus sandiegensis]